MPLQIDVAELAARLAAGLPTYLIDVREGWERERCALPDHLHLPLGELAEQLDEVKPPPGALVVAYCHHGVRSLSAAALLERAGHGAASLAGGIDRWSLRVDPQVARY